MSHPADRVKETPLNDIPHCKYDQKVSNASDTYERKGILSGFYHFRFSRFDFRVFGLEEFISPNIQPFDRQIKVLGNLVIVIWLRLRKQFGVRCAPKRTQLNRRPVEITKCQLIVSNQVFGDCGL